MKRLLMIAALIVVVLIGHSYANACNVQSVGDIVFETTGWIIDTDGVNIPFIADVSPFTYLVTLTDLSEAPNFGFDFLFLSITTATDTIDSLVGAGQFTFNAVSGQTYFVNVLGTGGGDLDVGLFGVEIKAVPIPASILLFGSGILGMVFLRRRKH